MERAVFTAKDTQENSQKHTIASWMQNPAMELRSEAAFAKQSESWGKKKVLHVHNNTTDTAHTHTHNIPAVQATASGPRAPPQGWRSLATPS